MEIILFEPEIPPNTGNIARLCAGLTLPLHLIEPLGFSLSDRYLRRAGLDYWPHVNIKVWEDFESFKENFKGNRLIGTSARRGDNFTLYTPQKDDGLVFGPETRGLPKEVQDQMTKLFNIPLKKEIRSLNLATTVGFFLGIAYSRLNIEA
jgi:tRNA (cytidine/uridine-2'-O-)-methyltransferase